MPDCHINSWWNKEKRDDLVQEIWAKRNGIQIESGGTRCAHDGATLRSQGQFSTSIKDHILFSRLLVSSMQLKKLKREKFWATNVSLLI